MSSKQAIHCNQAPKAIGPYSQAIRANDTVYFSGQIPLDPHTMEIINGDIEAQSVRVFENLKAVAISAGGDFQDIVKLTIYLVDLNNFSIVNEVMQGYFQTPYPARVTIGAAALPKNAEIEIDAVMVLNNI